MNRFFIDSRQGDSACIEGEDHKHLSAVLRMKAGEQVMISDAKGRECLGTVVSILKERTEVALLPWGPALGEPEREITLFQCLPKAGKMETILQKGTELGVCGFVPVQSRRCVVQPGKDFDKKLARYQKVVKEAAMQSGRGIIPRVHPLERIDRLDLSAFELTLVAYEGELAYTLKAAIEGFVGKRIAILIGPEGGFEGEEVALLQSRGARSVTLGRRILRTETAGMAMAAQILFALEG
ncbi:MAG: 16S rRNA (uracil(1498)-N(3))-methyltransferase [Clostridia bacterium]|nr:16S rRNA (uracil(1498)-N(3))-methyltransferase [Clostridia bacterium]